jgi:hypothetical protein
MMKRTKKKMKKKNVLNVANLLTSANAKKKKMKIRKRNMFLMKFQNMLNFKIAMLHLKQKIVI